MGSAEGARKAWETVRRRARTTMRVNLLNGCRATPVAQGIDTLHLYSDYAVKPDWATELEQRKAEAVAARDAGTPLPSLTLNGLVLQVAPYGTKKGPVLLTSDELAVVVHPNAPKGLPTMLIELRAMFLWGVSQAKAVEAAKEIVREICSAPFDVKLQLTRLDLAIDFTGWQPSPALLARFTCRAQRRSELYEQWRRAGGRKKVVQAFRKAAGTGDETARCVLERLLREEELSTGLHYNGRLFTGFSFGAGAIVARLYLKTREIEKSGKVWMREVWKKNGYRGGPVWRLEFQLRRELLKETHAAHIVSAEGEVAPFVLVSKRALYELGTGRVLRPDETFTTWSSTAENLEALWHYLTTEWLSLRMKRTAKRRGRIAGPWMVLRAAARFENQACGEVWRKKLENDHLRTLGQQAGYASKGLAERFALMKERPDSIDADAEVNAWVQEVRAYAAGRGRDVMDRALELWDGIDWRRRLYSAAPPKVH